MANAIRSFLFLLAPVIAYADADMVSLHPLYTPETAVLNPALVDLWADADKDAWLRFTFRIEPDGDTGYQILLERKKIATLHLVQLGGETIADMVVIQESLVPQLSLHYIARLRVEGNTLHSEWLGSGKLIEQIERTGSPRYERLSEEGRDEDVLVLTASTEELQRFILECLKQPAAFENPSRHVRASPEARAADLNEQSWDVVSRLGAGPKDYAGALTQAEEAVRLVPDNPEYWNTLGAAQYRARHFSEALAAITRAGQLRKEASPDDLIFRAMSHQQLGEKAEAKKVLGELLKMVGDSRNGGDQERLGLLREAENLIAPKAK